MQTGRASQKSDSKTEMTMTQYATVIRIVVVVLALVAIFFFGICMCAP